MSGIKVKGFFQDINGAKRVTKLREEKVAEASSVPDRKDPIRELADALHPAAMKFKVESIREASPTSRTYRFSSVDGHIPVFQCGQYVNFRLKIGESVLSRPYTLSSSPFEARGDTRFLRSPFAATYPILSRTFSLKT